MSSEELSDKILENIGASEDATTIPAGSEDGDTPLI
jgi:hypothetical protein